jgi:hypothetical protein
MWSVLVLLKAVTGAVDWCQQILTQGQWLIAILWMWGSGCQKAMGWRQFQKLLVWCFPTEQWIFTITRISSGPVIIQIYRPHCQSFWLSLWQALRYCFPEMCPFMLLPLLWWPYFGNHSFRGMRGMEKITCLKPEACCQDQKKVPAWER